ncbi:MAG: zinc ribbon domain-containing protein [Nitrospira sp.]|nr:zinc ribbon domain-containing protein [Nitrospira sp.]
MPIYEYRCQDCDKRSSLLVLSISHPPPLACNYCHSAKLERVLSRFASPKSEEARLESLADPSHLGGLDDNDPKSMARFMKKMGEEMGEDVGDDVEAALDEAGAEGEASSTTDID